MENNKVIKFINYTPKRYEEENTPVPIIKTLPEWYKSIPRYVPMAPEKSSTVKNCVPFFDAMTSGYSLLTPCDIEFFEEDGIPKVRVLDGRFEDFVVPRGPMDQFSSPEGYHKHHFHWYPGWAIELPKGYSALYMPPLNRFELPFLTTSGIIDNDKLNINGQMPFFIKTGFTGIIKKGTPFIQIIPIKRERWSSDIELLSLEEVMERRQSGTKKYREPKANGYRDSEWERKYYL